MMENLLLTTTEQEIKPTGPRQLLFTAGTYNLTVTAEMIPMHCLVIGPGGGGGYRVSSTLGVTCGAGGGTAFLNDMPVSVGDILEIMVGTNGTAGTIEKPNGTNGSTGCSVRVNGILMVNGSLGASGIGTTNSGITSIGSSGGGGFYIGKPTGGGGKGGDSGSWVKGAISTPGAGGAGGYTGDGGRGADATTGTGTDIGRTNGSGGGGAGGKTGNVTGWDDGGSIGAYGMGVSGVNNGSGDPNKIHGSWNEGMIKYGGGGGIGKDGMPGVVRLLFGKGREFPSTNVHDIE